MRANEFATNERSFSDIGVSVYVMISVEAKSYYFVDTDCHRS